VRRFSLAATVFLAILVSAFATTILTGVVAYESLVTIVHAALAAAPGLSLGTEELVRASAEQQILRSFDTSSYVMVLSAGAAAMVASFTVAIRLTRPVRELDAAVEEFTRGNRDRRAVVRGPREIASLGSSFNNMADALEEEDHLRRTLVADLGHELRNPITVAMAQTEAMLDGVLPADTTHLRTLLTDMQYLSRLVDDLQELALAESGRWRYRMRPVDLSELIESNARRAEQRVSPGVEVRVEGTDLPVMVYGDELRLDQVLRNILGNAKKHTTADSITLSLAVAPEVITVRVADTGEGISPENLPHIFERFFRADTARTSDKGSAGLGLSIARAIIRDHCGDVFAESELGHGTVIGFTLPHYHDAVPPREGDRLGSAAPEGEAPCAPVSS
jgi:two-component system sensor histidine kinase BaeS